LAAKKENYISASTSTSLRIDRSVKAPNDSLPHGAVCRNQGRNRVRRDCAAILADGCTAAWKKKCISARWVKRRLAYSHTASSRVFDAFGIGVAAWLPFCPMVGTDAGGDVDYKTGLNVALKGIALRMEVMRATCQGWFKNSTRIPGYRIHVSR